MTAQRGTHDHYASDQLAELAELAELADREFSVASSTRRNCQPKRRELSELSKCGREFADHFATPLDLQKHELAELAELAPLKGGFRWKRIPPDWGRQRGAGDQKNNHQGDAVSEPTHLYRAYNADGQLLYVGIAKNWPNRWTAHARTATFYGQVARLDVETHPTRDDALVAERAAIKREHPVHNVVHNRGEVQPALSPKPAPSRNTRRQSIPGSTAWHFESKATGFARYEHLWLQYEINLSSCLTEAYPDEDPLEFFLDYLGDLAQGTLTITWTVKGPTTREVAPFDDLVIANPYASTFPNFLRSFTWPVDDDGATLNWFSLPVECRFPELENALGWKPSPMQRDVNFGALMRSLRGR